MKYCSHNCRRKKAGRLDRDIEGVFVQLLEGSQIEGQKAVKGKAGDTRILVPCSVVQRTLFRGGEDLEKITSEKEKQWRSVDMEDSDENDSSDSAIEADNETSSTRESHTKKNGDGTLEERRKREEGQQRAEEKEMVKRAARRGCAFGFEVQESLTQIPKKKPNVRRDTKHHEIVPQEDTKSHEKQETTRRLCEAVMNGKVVEPSFAKGDWGVRWRE